jgi:diguanylate cyclase (GGDEF)-like protein
VREGTWVDDQGSLSRLAELAATARRCGEFGEAAVRYDEAARLAPAVEQRLHLRMREAFCHVALGDLDRAEHLALQVATEARSELCFAELADALGLLVDRRMADGLIAEAAELLSEVMYVMERVPNEPSWYQVVHNTAVTYQRCDFPLPALVLYDRALRLAEHDVDRTFVYANMASAYHMACNYETDPAVAMQHTMDGIAAATAALDPEAECEVMVRALALAHRSVLLNTLGDHATALADAVLAREISEQHGLREERVVALVGEAVARWHLHHDDGVLDLIGEAAREAAELGVETYLTTASPVGVEILWSAGRFDDARAVMDFHCNSLQRALHRERAARWGYVRLGVSHRSTEALSESDPLTGLPNRRYLGHFLPDVMEDHGPVCVAVLDLDGFKRINDEYSYAHGDRVLQELSGILQRICRRGDAVVRLGGDEFVLVLRETSPHDARAVLERVRQMIAVRTWEGLPRSVSLTASVGVAVGGAAIDAGRVLTTASEALQTAKRSGRDRIVFS